MLRDIRAKTERALVNVEMILEDYQNAELVAQIMENEATKTLKKYFSSDDGTDIRYLGKGEGARLFADCFQNGAWFAGDVPDMLIKKEETAILIEHFEFDSYPVTRKGSKNRREQDRIERCAERVEPTAQGVYYCDEIRGDSSLESYLSNCLGSFQRHYQQIERYKDNLRKPNFQLL